MELRAEAERYCALIEQAPSMERERFADAVVAALESLVAVAGLMPEVPPTEAELPDGPSHAEWRERLAALQATLGDWEDPVLSLADDLADVWRDLKEGLMALQSGATEADVAWEWRFGFHTHWGPHAQSALRALRARV